MNALSNLLGGKWTLWVCPTCGKVEFFGARMFSYLRFRRRLSFDHFKDQHEWIHRRNWPALEQGPGFRLVALQTSFAGWVGMKQIENMMDGAK